MDEFGREAAREWQARRAARQRVFWLHAVVWGAVGLLLVTIWALAGAGFPWFLFPVLGWGVGLAAHGATAYLLRSPEELMVLREARRDRGITG